MKINKILITGATGNVGSEVIKMLGSVNDTIVIGVRNIEKARNMFGDNNKINYVPLDFKKQDTYEEALEGISKIFLVRPPEISNVQEFIFPFIDKAREKEVSHIVFLSLLGVEKNPFVPHYKIEKYIKESGISYTFLRASFFMQNLDTTHRKDIKERNEIFLPAGKGKTSFIDVRDIAEVATMSLTEDGHQNKAYSLTGKEALDYYDVAEIFSHTLKRNIKYTKPSVFRFFYRMKKRGMKTGYILVMIALYTTARIGLAKKTTEDLKKLLNKEPISFEQYVRDYRDCWE